MGFFDNIKNSGVLDTVKSAALKAKCATGLHAGNFQPVVGKPKCNLEKTCPDCDKRVTKVNHKFDEYKYVHNHKCEISRSCIHCNEIETSEKHQEFKEIAIDDYCRPKEECVRCRTQRIGKEKHSWTKSSITSPSESTVEWWCTRCKKTEMRDKTSF